MTEFLKNTSPPAGNTGGKIEREVYVLLHDGEKSLPVLINRPVDGEIVAIDWIAISGGAETFGDEYLGIPESEREKALEQLAQNFDVVLKHIFGFGIAQKRKTGLHFYSDSWELHDGFGMFLAGHTTGRISIDINGTGLSYALEGWQSRLHTFMTLTLERAQITRIDLMCDFFNGEYSVDWALEQFMLNRFNAGGNAPKPSQMGNWLTPDNEGRTFGVGKRKNGKYARIYEKGKELGDKSSLWVRHELELRNKDRIIPFDVLINPTSYFRAAYPCFMDFPTEIPECRISTKQKESKITWNKAIAILSTSYGKYLHQFRQVYNDDVILNMLTHDKTDVPKRLIPCEILAKRHFESFINSTSDSRTASGKGSQVKTLKDA